MYFLSEDLLPKNSKGPDENVAFHLVFTVCKSISLGIFRIQRVKDVCTAVEYA